MLYYSLAEWKVLSKNLIIFDLDETLIHATEKELNYPAHFRFEDYYVFERPGLRAFLTEIAKHFRIGIWSSAGDVYVQGIAKEIFTEAIEPVFVWGRTKCTMKRDFESGDYYYEKKLDKLKKKGLKLEKILIVDDSQEKSRSNYGNVIYIKEFTGDPNDAELHFLYDYLLSFKMVDNVRIIEKRGWRN